MSQSLSKCTKCDWTGYDPKWVLCPVCGKTYYMCPNCRNRAEPVKPVYVNIVTPPNSGVRPSQRDEDISRYFLNKFKELGIEPKSVNTMSKKTNKTINPPTIEKET